MAGQLRVDGTVGNLRTARTPMSRRAARGGDASALTRLPAGRVVAVPLRRRLAGAAVGASGLLGITLGLLAVESRVELSTALLSYLALTMLVATIGGLWPSLPSALAGFATANWFFTPPFRTWTVDHGQDVLALAVFLAVAVVVSGLVHLVERRAAEAARARAEAAALTRLAISVADSDDPLGRVVGDLVRTFSLDAAAILSCDEASWRVDAAAGQPQLGTPDDGTDVMALNGDTFLVLRGPHAPADDQRILAAFVAQLALAVQRQSLEAEAARAEILAEGNRLRTALLSAVSHDLRTPLATVKAWLTGLLEADVAFSERAVNEILAAAVGEVDRLNALVGNLLDMSRLHAGAVQVNRQPVALDAVAAAALDSVPDSGRRVRMEVPDSLRQVDADAALLERVVANLVDNALRHTPGDTAVEVRAAPLEDSDAIELRVIDHGPGIPLEERDRIFQAFQRLGDRPDGSGVGLGLAVAKGLTEAIRGQLAADDTPGGGTTMLLTLPASR